MDAPPFAVPASHDSHLFGRLLRFAAITLLFCVWAAPVNAQSAPELRSWIQNSTGRTGRYTLTNGQSGVNLAAVQLVRYNTTDVYVSSTGIPEYDIGPFGGNPNVPAAQQYLFRFPRAPREQTGTKTVAALGAIGLWTNGVAVYNALDAFSWSNQLQRDLPDNGNPAGDGVWNRNAVLAEADGLDVCLGHPAMGGRYHHHQNPRCLRLQLGDTTESRHSPILGWAFDGYPMGLSDIRMP